MADKILADTSILIDLQKGEDNTILTFDKIKELACISRITACEFIYGSTSKKEKHVNKDFIERLEIIDISEEISKYAYFLLDKYNLGIKFGISDAIIAATAITRGYMLWTRNLKHFKRIKELKLFQEDITPKS